MSCYIVEDKTINRVITRLNDEVNNTVNPFISPSWLNKHFSEQGFEIKGDETKDNTGEVLERLAIAMAALNVMSVDQRYKETNVLTLIRYQQERCSLIQAYKSLRCYLYQPCEGEAAEQPLYKLLNWLSNEWAREIVGSLPEYDKAEWA